MQYAAAMSDDSAPHPTARFDAVLFDLDGTLADTLADVAACGNHMLAKLGRPAIELNRYRYLAGQGARSLVRDALGVSDDDPRVDEGVALFKAYQLEHGADLTRPYPGMPELLDGLTRRGVKLAVLSNKPHAATVEMIRLKFAAWTFHDAVGHRDGWPLKPDPASALDVAARMGVPAERWMYLGDTRVDMETAGAAGMFAVGVLWGFRDEAELRGAGADAIIADPRQALDLL